MDYLTAVRWKKFQRVFFVVLLIKSSTNVKMFPTNDFYQCHSLMNEKKKKIKFVYRECFKETYLTNNNITS